MDLLISGVLGLGSVAYFYRLAAPSGSGPRALSTPYQIPDAFFVLVLVAWFLLNIIGSHGKVVTVNTDVLVMNAVFSFLLIICVLSFLIVRSMNPLTLFGLGSGGFSRSVPVAPVALLCALPAIYFIHALSFHFLGKPEPQPLLQFFITNTAWNDRLLLAFTAIVVAPVAEELVFRGYIYGVARRFAGRWWALGISAVIFAAIHAHLPALGGLLVLAVALTLVYEYTASLWAPILMHSLFNTLTIAATLTWPDLMK